MPTLSLNMLKGAKAPPPPPVEEAPEAASNGEDHEAAVAEAESFDVDKMSIKEIDQLVIDHELDVPANWKQMIAKDKRKYLNEKYRDAAVSEPQAAAEDASEIELTEAQAAAVVGNAKAETAKGKAVALKPKAKSGQLQVPGEDAIVDMVHEVENMDEASSLEAVDILKETAEVTFFKLGGVLSRIQTNEWFKPHASFKDYIENEHGMKYRRAMKWIEIYNNLAESGVPWSSVKELGWTKLGVISSVLNPKNVKQWVKLAEKNTTLQLEDIVKGQQSKNAPQAIEDQASSTVTTMTFKVHEDQKETIQAAIDKAKEISGTTVATAALEFICTEYIAGGEGQVNWPVVMKKAGYEKILETFGEVFPDIGLEVTVPEGEEAEAA
jgi:hypothetical protein